MKTDQLKAELADCKQVVYSLQTDLEFARWENAERDKGFLLEMKDRLSAAWDSRDASQYQMVTKMIDDWISELSTNQTKGGEG